MNVRAAATKSKKTRYLPGQIHAIPLFTSKVMSDVRFTKKDLEGRNKKFVFMRLIKNAGGSGLIVEVFDLVGGLDTPIEEIERAKRLFRPIAISALPIVKKRWLRIGQTENYDPERDSEYSKIELVMSPLDHPVLYRGSTKRPIAIKDVPKYEEWKLWRAHQLETRILKELKEAG